MSDICLGDDGTMDTVVYCADCGQEGRYNYDPSFGSEETYNEFVKWAIEDFGNDHVCDQEVYE